MTDQMPKWMLQSKTKEQLKRLYDRLPIVNKSMTFEEYIEEWERQRKELS